MNISTKRLIILLLLIFSITLTSCANSNNKMDVSNIDIGDVDFVDEADLVSLYSDPNKYIDKGVKLHGQVFSIEKDEDSVFLQVWVDINGEEKNTIIVDTLNNYDYSDGEIIYFEGIVFDEFEGENAMGGKITAPAISIINMEDSNFIDAYKPTIDTLEVQQTIEQHNISFSIEKIEFAKEETRFYVKISNNSSDEFSIYTHTAKVIQNGKQLEHEYVFEDDYPEIQTDLLPKVTTEGILVFPPMKSDENFDFQIRGTSDNWELDFEDFIFNL